METIKSIFDEECVKLVIDKHLLKKISQYQLFFVNKNEDHIKFFGGNLLGVQVVRFMPQDYDHWFDEVLCIDYGPLGERLETLEEIQPEFRKVTSDTFNLSCIWLCHAILNSHYLTPEEKQTGMIDTLLVLQYKFITSLLYHYFKYPADRQVAEAAYAQLSYKFAIKVYGSWAAVLRNRAESICSQIDPITNKPSIHYDAIMHMGVDKDVTYVLSDSQGRIRDIVKNYYFIFDMVKNSNGRIISTSSIVEYDGEVFLRDKTKNLTAYGRYLNSIITDKNSFIRNELVVIIEKLMHTMSPRLFMETLVWMSTNYRQDGVGVIEEVLNETLIHSFDYLNQERGVVRNTTDIPGLLDKLRGVYMSSRSTDPILISLRSKMETVVKLATGNKTESMIASVRTATMLYIVLRAFTMKHYTG
jgi:hypothetical protein